jgi:hypothetical protein
VIFVLAVAALIRLLVIYLLFFQAADAGTPAPPPSPPTLQQLGAHRPGARCAATIPANMGRPIVIRRMRCKTRVGQVAPATAMSLESSVVPDRRMYEASQIDWTALRALAHQGAAGTQVNRNPPVNYRNGSRVVEAVGTHWLLDSRSHHITQTYHGTGYQTEEETHEQHLYVLLPDGSLRLVAVTTEEVTVLEDGARRSGHTNSTHSSREFGEAEVLMFDFENQHQHYPQAWGNRERGDVLLVDGKGAGLSEALSDLLAGRRASMPSPIPPLEMPATPTPSAGTGSDGLSGDYGSLADSTPDVLAIAGTVVLAITVLVPFLVGHFLMTHTFVLKPSAEVYAGEVRGIKDHFLATYLAGLLSFAILVGTFLVLRRPWKGRNTSVVIGWVALIGALVVLLPATRSEWRDAEKKTVAKLRETSFPFSGRYLSCGGWTINAENGAHQPELWQVYLGNTSGTPRDQCNRVIVYRGWRDVGEFGLPGGDAFTRDIVVNHVGWDQPYRGTETGEIGQANRVTGERTPMNPLATNVDLPTKSGRVLDFNLDAAGTNGFDLR